MAGMQKTSFKADAPYGYDTNYQWLRGQLDYAPGNGGWRIMYVPAYGTGDRLGGSLTIANPQALSGLQHGDHVELRGRLVQRWTGGPHDQRLSGRLGPADHGRTIVDNLRTTGYGLLATLC